MEDRERIADVDKVEAVAKVLAIQTLEDESTAASYVWQWVIDNDFVEEYYQRASEILKLFPEYEPVEMEALELTEWQILALIPAQAIIDYDQAKKVLDAISQATVEKNQAKGQLFGMRD